MAKTNRQTTNSNPRSFWSQRTDDIGNTGDKGETLKIYGQMTGKGLVSTENKSKNNFNKK